jgi:hypothetical protein
MILTDWFDSLYSRLPGFSLELKHFVVSILPFVAIIFGVLITFASSMDILGTPFFSVFSSGEGAGVFQKLMLVNIIGITQGVLMILSFRPLRRRLKRGWRLVFWSQILWVASALITLSPSFVLGFVFLYPLFQVRDSYK